MSADNSFQVSMELLRTLHRIQRQRSDLQSQIERGPRQLKASEAIVAQHQSEAVDAVDKLKKAKMAVDQKQLQLKSREERIRDLQKKLNTAANNREYSLLKEQIAADEQANEVLSDEILEGLERLDELELQRGARAEELKERQSDHTALCGQVELRLKGLKDDLSKVEAELVEAEAQLPASLKVDYDRIVAARGEEALAPVDGENCGGCYQTLTSQMMNRLYLAQAVRCPACGAMLYLPEDRRVR